MKKYIYGLICPISKDVRYVGVTTNQSKYKLPNTQKYDRWINQLHLFRNEPVLKILEEVSISESNDRLTYWRDYYNII